MLARSDVKRLCCCNTCVAIMPARFDCLWCFEQEAFSCADFVNMHCGLIGVSALCHSSHMMPVTGLRELQCVWAGICEEH